MTRRNYLHIMNNVTANKNAIAAQITPAIMPALNSFVV